MEWMLMPLRRYAEFSGRSRRMEYWMFILFQWLLSMALYVVAIVLIGGGAMMTGFDPRNPAGVAAAGGGILLIGGLAALLWLGFLIPSLAVAVRRLHDSDRTGWWIVAPLAGYLVAFIGAIAQSTGLVLIGMGVAMLVALAVLVFMFLDGTPGPNRFGEDPKLRGVAAPAMI